MAALPELIQDGIRYVPTKAIAKSVGLSPRYLADFCRDSKVAAVFHKGAWYVEESSLRAYLAQHSREQEAYNRKLSEDAKREVEENARKAKEAHARSAREARRIRRRESLAKTLAATFATVTLLISSALAFEIFAPPNSIARQNLTNNLASAHDQLAAVSSLPFVDALASNIFNTFCPLFRNCPEPASQLTARELPLVQNSRTAIAATSSPRTLATSPAKNSTPTTVINQPVIERIREVQTAGVNAAYVDARIAALAASMQRQMEATADANATSFRSVSSSASSPTSVAASAITGTITNAISSALATITDLTSTTLTATNATFTNATSTNFAATTASTTNLTTGSLTVGSGTGVLQSTSGVVSAITSGSNGQVLKLVGGTPAWSTDLQGSGGGSSVWATSTDDLSVSPSDTSDVIIIGSNATTTTGNILEVAGASLFRGNFTSYYNVTAPRFTATSSTASILPYASSTALTVSGTGYFGSASTSALTVSDAPGGILKTNSSGTVSVATLGSDYLSAASSIEDLSDVAAITENYGDLFAWNGSAWTDFATSSLAIALSDTTGTLGATRGGTGLSSVTAAGILLGNYAGTGWQQLATSTLGLLTTHVAEGSNQYYTDARVQSFVHASSTIPKTYTANTFSALQTFGNASTTNLSASYASSTEGFFGSLSIGSLTGFLKATAGTIATALVDLASNVTGILGVANGGTGWSNVASGAVVLGNGTGALATTSAGTNGQILALVSGTPTWVATTTLSTISGTLAVGSGGTGQTTFTSSQLLYGNGTNGLSSVATSTFTSGTGISVTGNGYAVGLSPTISFSAPASSALSIPFASTTMITATTASTTNFTLSSSPNAILLTNAAGVAGSYAGSTCTNQFVRSLTGAGVATCATVSLTADVTGTLGVGNGGTGWAAIQSGSIPYGNGSSPFSTTTAGTAGHVLALLNGVPTWAATSTLSTIGGTLAVGSGGTNATSLGNHMLLAFNGTSVVASSTPTAAAYLATSTTATSTFAGGITGPGSFTVQSSSGNVGIGTSNPGVPLHVSNSVGGVALFNSTAANGSYITFANSGSSYADIGAAKQAIGGGNSASDLGINVRGANNLVFGTNNAERMRIDSSGNVGIGTTTPDSKLTINHNSGYSSSAVGLKIANATTPLKSLNIGYDTTIDASFLQSVHDGTAYKNLALNALGGNVGIGTTSPLRQLHVTSSALIGADASSLSGITTPVGTNVLWLANNTAPTTDTGATLNLGGSLSCVR